MVANVELAKQPIESQLFQIILIDLDEFCFDLDLLRPGDACLFHNRIDQLKIVGGVADD